MSNNDLFSKLTGNGDPKPTRSGSTESGLSSLDLLELPSDQRKLISWLTRRSQATLQEIADGLKVDPEKVMAMVSILRESKYIYEALHDGLVFYRVVFRNPARQKTSEFMTKLLARVDIDNKTFLKSVAIFGGLTDDQFSEIANLVVERDYATDEVILWQGSVSDYMYFVKSGIVTISRVSGDTQEQRIIAYLKPGDILGEYSVMSRPGAPATATATATSRATLLLIPKDKFLDLLTRYPAVTVEVIRILVARLLMVDDRSEGEKGKLVIVIGTGHDVGASLIATTLAMTLSKVTEKKTGYAELPNPDRLRNELGLEAHQTSFSHAAGFDILFSAGAVGISPSVRATLIVGQLIAHYANVVVNLDSEARDLLTDLVPRADQLVYVTSPKQWERLGILTTSLHNSIHPERTAVFTIVNRVGAEEAELRVPRPPDVDLPYTANLPNVASLSFETCPEALGGAAKSLADRLGRANQVSLFIPTTIDVNQTVDTTAFVERTLAFLGERFGGATTNRARGVWNSADSGLVGEEIHIVRSYATQADLNKHLKDILNYVEGLKRELKQEAMAVEINQKLMLI
jgi:CRP-like cAMP-binding protein